MNIIERQEPLPAEDLWYTTDEVCAVLKKCRQTILTYGRELKIIPDGNLHGRPIRWTVTDVKMIMRAMQQKKTGKRNHQEKVRELVRLLGLTGGKE